MDLAVSSQSQNLRLAGLLRSALVGQANDVEVTFTDPVVQRLQDAEALGGLLHPKRVGVEGLSELHDLQ